MYICVPEALSVRSLIRNNNNTTSKMMGTHTRPGGKGSIRTVVKFARVRPHNLLSFACSSPSECLLINPRLLYTIYMDDA